MSPHRITGTSAASAKPILAISPLRKLTSAGLPAPSTITRSYWDFKRSKLSRTEAINVGFSFAYSRAFTVATRLPCTMTCDPTSDSGFNKTGFISVCGGTPQARACNACARPISPPSAVTAALLDIFCGLNGATDNPRRLAARHRPATSIDFPTFEPVPWIMTARVMALTFWNKQTQLSHKV